MGPFEPSAEQVLAFCAEEPIERVFLEDVARRGLGRFRALGASGGDLTALCHVGANVVPTGANCAAFAPAAVTARARMIIGEERAVGELWAAAEPHLPRPRDDRPGQPVYDLRAPPAPGDTGVRAATLADHPLSRPRVPAAHLEEIGIDPLQRDPHGFRWRTRAQIEEGRSWLWERDGTILFKAEASAWTPHAVQLQQVWVDPGGAEPRLRAEGNARPLPAPARARARRLPVRPPRERPGDPGLRGGRLRETAFVPQCDPLRTLVATPRACAS